MIEALKANALHNNIGASVDTGDRYLWYSATGWIMWNSQVSALLGGTTICIYDGNPGGRIGATDMSTLWRFAAAAGTTFFGAGAAFYANCLKAGVEPMKLADLSKLRAIGSTGSPLAVDSYQWVYEQMPKRDGQPIWLTAISGGTDTAGLFVGGVPTLPVVVGEMQVRCLGSAIEAWNEAGQPLVDEVGELVCIKPMPSMPLVLLERQGQPALPRQLLRHVPRRLAPRRLDPHHAARRRHHLRPQRRDHQPPRHPHGHGRALQRGRGAARGARQPGRRPRIPGPRELHAALRRAARGRWCSTPR